MSFRFKHTRGLKDKELRLRLLLREPADEEKGYVPSYHFAIMHRKDRVMVGRIDLRVGYNESLYYGGNTGYFVEEEHRGNHYAEKAVRLLLRLARRHKMDKIIITCNPDNVPSRRTCERLGAAYIETVDLPKDNEMYLEGERQKRIYEIKP